MAIIRWNPWNELFDLHSQMDALFNTTFGSTTDGGGTQRRGALTEPREHLAVDIRQSDEAYTIEASVPGLRPEDVQVTFDDGVLTIAGARQWEGDEGRADDYVRRERRVTALHRQIVLPQEVVADDIRAAFENGVLTVVVPRARRAEPRRIPVATTMSALSEPAADATAGQ